ncbi:anti-anti-sigma factor [Pontibacter aydingkolensis]|uniref:Anti-sigma factor antagonist n=1 Tax=Pontibacter aydingkolensis TaxID=1911536 RepID=A0ABS7CVS1_9BACT|nr:STAS domain-containing protein [Pontibacter aydingkolensis]MBW7467927.1 STAS domain-containing protein [Pontibacter aydingkolensis]
MERFIAEVDQLERVVAVRLTGELDANTAVSADDALQEAIANAIEKALLIDCTGLHYISSAGLGVILSSLHACKQNSTKVVFCGLQPKIKNVFAILGLEKIIVAAVNEEEAMKLLNGSPKPPKV